VLSTKKNKKNDEGNSSVFRKNSKKILIASDTHCGSLWGLTPPQWHIEKYKSIQQSLWDFWESITKEKYDVAIFNGDLIDGSIDELEHIVIDREEQVAIAVESLKRVKANKYYIVEGTPAHTVGEGSFERIVASQLNIPCSPHLRLEINGVRMHIRHVTGNSSAPYSALLKKEIVRQIWTDENFGIDPPHLIIRSHVHKFEVTYDDRAMGFTTPSLELPFSIYGRTQRPWKYDVGVVKLYIDEEGHCYPDPILLKIRVVRDEIYEKI